MNGYFDNIETGIPWEPMEALIDSRPEWDLPIADLEKFLKIQEKIQNKDFGRWGNARKKYLIENRPDKLVSLAQEMNIEKYLTKINSTAGDRLLELENNMKESIKNQNNWLETAQLYNNIRMNCQEIVNQEIIFPEE